MTIRPISDETLDKWEANSAAPGYRNSVPHLRPFTPEQRGEIYAEAGTLMNIEPGWVFSRAVARSAENFRKGLTPAADRAAALLAWDPTGNKAASGATPPGGWRV
jgi:hypothetical protein